ncbi:MFS transporter [Pseudomonas putida]|uniref:MFS transporter n=1 Tax=Pseudomonas TaxID=286 RepID=UPI0010599743|nr:MULTISPECIES: MFS transporter [Pseudomonas]MBF8747527.1 MFS transporter [Pseudomonas monteilii]MCT8167015.1 MFS transporter [Pseudomonas sp. HD6422]MCT8185998.1 MFS transporter [Pseudomonas sp. HD6421]TDJ77486.1 MFS transporter [Pseudomonas putida]
MKSLRLRPTTVVLCMLCAMYFITYLDRVNVSTAAVGFGPEFGLSKTEIGIVFSAFAYPYLVFQIIGGWVSDRFGAKRTLVFCGILWAAATVMTGLAGGFISLIIARILLGLGEGATFPAATAAMSRWVPKEKRGFAQGITHAFARLGNALAPAAMIAIMAAYGWRESFYVCAVISFVWVGLWALVFTDSPKRHPRISQAELDALPVAKAKNKNPLPWGRLFRRMAPVTIVYFCYGWTLWLLLSWVPMYFMNLGLDLKGTAIFSSAVFFGGVVGDTLGGIVSDRIYAKTGNLNKARSRMVAICLSLTLLSLLPLMFTTDMHVSLACLAIGFFFSEMTIGPMWAIPMDIAPDHSGTASGMMNTGSAMAAIISPVAAGMLIDTFDNWQLPFLVSIILLAIGVVLSFRMKPQNRFEYAKPPVVPASDAHPSPAIGK